MSLPALLDFALALALLLALLALHVRVGSVPFALAALVRKERAQDGGKLLDAMAEAVAARSGHALIAIQSYQEQLAQSLRVQIAEAETRARIAERRAADTTLALDGAAALVRELRAALEAAAALTGELRALETRPTVSPAPPGGRPAALPTNPDGALDGDETERATTEMPSSVAPSRREGPAGSTPPSGRQPRQASDLLPRIDDDDGGFGDEDEKTKVADRPAALAALRRARRSPTLLPPAPGERSRG